MIHIPSRATHQRQRMRRLLFTGLVMAAISLVSPPAQATAPCWVSGLGQTPYCTTATWDAPSTGHVSLASSTQEVAIGEALLAPTNGQLTAARFVLKRDAGVTADLNVEVWSVALVNDEPFLDSVID